MKYNKAKQFNFKLFHRFVPCRWNLCKWKVINYTECEICHVPDTTRHMMLECKDVKLFWKIVSRIIYHLYKLDIEVNEKILVIGYKIDRSEFYLMNLMIIFAQYTIYKNYIQSLKKGTKVNAKCLFHGMKSDLRFYLNSKINISVKKEKVKCFLDMLNEN